MVSDSISFFSISIGIGISTRINIVGISCISCIDRYSACVRLLMNSYFYIYVTHGSMEEHIFE